MIIFATKLKIMKELIEKLKVFKGAIGGTLEKQFEEIAKYLICGGYFLCNNKYRLYISSVEFYYHEEIERDGRIVDPIMYHRNKWNNYINAWEEFEFFPIGTLYPHQSGVDITFECPGKYRASALIREFYITKADNPNMYHNWKYYSSEAGWGEQRSIDKRPSYVYEWLFNGLGVSSSMFVWIEENNHMVKLSPLPDTRINVYKYENVDTPEKYKITKEKCDRKWRYYILK